MIICPNCNHQNPDGASQCEACYTPLPVTTSCPNCGTTVQADAHFCGQCGFNLQGGAAISTSQATVAPGPMLGGPNLAQPLSSPPLNLPATASNPEAGSPTSPPGIDEGGTIGLPSIPAGSMRSPNEKTQLQQQTARLIHIRTNALLELPSNLTIIHIGKPNDRVPPDLDVSGFPDSDIVSRVHADIRIEGDSYYIEDVGSSNGTYINNVPLPVGNRHRLRPGDRVALGKGDRVAFLFQLS